MKLTIKLLVLFFGVLMLSNAANAASPREQLKQMVEQLQKNPTDNVLREKIIKLARTIKPAPAVPQEARRYLARGIAAFEIAKNAEDFKLALPEFQNAANAAPWWPDTYFNLAKVQEKTGDLKGAIASYNLYLTADPNAKDAESIRTQSYKLEFMAEQKAKEEQAMSERKAREEEARAREEKGKKQRQAWAAEIVQWLRQNYGGRELHYWITNRDSSTHSLADGIGRRISYSIGGNDMDEIKIVSPTFDTWEYCGIPSSSSVRDVQWRFCKSGEPRDFNFAATIEKTPLIVITFGNNGSHTIDLEP